jgi:hypothetical protein
MIKTQCLGTSILRGNLHTGSQEQLLAEPDLRQLIEKSQPFGASMADICQMRSGNGIQLLFL